MAKKDKKAPEVNEVAAVESNSEQVFNFNDTEKVTIIGTGNILKRDYEFKVSGSLAKVLIKKGCATLKN